MFNPKKYPCGKAEGQDGIIIAIVLDGCINELMNQIHALHELLPA